MTSGIVGDIGTFYDAQNVKQGSAVGFISAVGTPDPADSITVFDPAIWVGATVDLGTPTAGTFAMSLKGGRSFGTVDVTGIAFGAIASAIESAIQAVLPEGFTATVTGGPADTTPFVVSITGPGASQVVVVVDGTGLTGAAVVTTPSPWSAAGGTEQGWQVVFNPTTEEKYIDEQQTPVDQAMTQAILQFTANLAEDVVLSWGLVLNADATVQAPSNTLFGKTTLVPSRTLKRKKVVLEHQSVGDFPVRWIVDEMTCAANTSAAFRRASGLRLIPVTFTSVCPLSGIKRVEITADHT